MEQILSVHSLEEWNGTLHKLGKQDVVAVSWKFSGLEQAAAESEIISKNLLLNTPQDGPRVRAEAIPPAAVAAGYSVAKLITRHTLSSGNLTRNPVAFGINKQVTGLHADINIENGEALSPALTTLYVAKGAIHAYFKSLPVDTMELNTDAKASLFDALDQPDTSSHNGFAIRESAKKLFAQAIFDQGTVIAFPAAGNPNLGIAPVAHQMETLHEPRVTVSLADGFFARGKNLS